MFKVESTDGVSSIGMNVVDIETNYPSICVVLEIKNQGFSAHLSEVWIEWDCIEEFITKSKEIAYKSNFHHSIDSISPDEMKLKIAQVNAEIFSLKYVVTKVFFESETIQLKGSFELGMEKVMEWRTFLKEIAGHFG